MSSSRIIKSGSCADRPVAEFCFNTFRNVAERPFRANGAGFVPFFHEGGEEPLEVAEEQEIFTDLAPVDEEDNGGTVRMSEEEFQKRLQEAFEMGAEGERKQADEDLAGICSALSEAISVVSRLKERILRESEDELLNLAFMVAKKIVRQEIKHDRRILAQVVSEALKGFPEQHDIVVLLNPEDYRVITSNRELFLAEIGTERQITLKPDESTTLGGCIVESSTGVIDARIEAQLDEIYKGLVEERGRLDESAAQAASVLPDEEPAP